MRFPLLLIFVGCSGLGLGYGVASLLSPLAPRKDLGSKVPEVKTLANNSPSPLSYREAVAAPSKAVVNVLVDKEPQSLFPAATKALSLGSGVIIAAEGLVVTNYHVIGEAQKIRLVLADGREREAALLGADEATDLALLKIKSEALIPEVFPFLPFCVDEDLSIGDLVFAIGNPYGIGQTVTMGIVSAKNRENLGISDYEEFIQTDAAINPGNSGGALIDSTGQLVGINTAIFSESGGYQGIGFAIPSGLASRIVTELQKSGRISRASLGVSAISLKQSQSKLASFFASKGFTEGALVIEVKPNTAASELGLGRGSLILALDGTPIHTAEDLFKLVAQKALGSEIELGFVLIDVASGGIVERKERVRLNKL